MRGRIALLLIAFFCFGLTLSAQDRSEADPSPLETAVSSADAPTIITQNITVFLNASGNASITPEDVDNGSSDPAGGLTLSLDISSFTCANLGDNVVTLTGTNGLGESESATAIVTVEDNIAPKVVTQNLTAYIQNGVYVIDPNDLLKFSGRGRGGVTGDNCAIVSAVASPATLTVLNLGMNSITVTVFDAAGNSAQGVANVTLKDEDYPVAMAQDITVNLDENGLASVTAEEIDNGSYDDGGINQMFLDVSQFDCKDLGPNPVVLTVIDYLGRISTATATVTVKDVTDPEIVTQNITVALGADGEVTIDPLDLLVICPDADIMVGTGGTTGETVPGAGDEYEILEYFAEQAPTCSSDNCTITDVSSSIETFDCSLLGANTVTVTIKDGSGNTASATAVVTIVDDVFPTIQTKNYTVNLDQSGNASITVEDVDDNSFDNCDIALSLDKLNFTCADVGDNVVTLTGVDPSGNSSAGTAVVTVVDTAPPVAVATTATLSLDANGLAVLDPSQINDGSFDSCSSVTLTVSKNTFNCDDLGENTVTLIVTDESGNVATVNTTVTIEDNIAPTIITKNATVVLDDTGNAVITLDDINDGSYDNCDLTLSFDPISFTCAEAGQNVVTLTGVDGSGNSASATAIVTVVDPEAPVVETQDVTLVLDANGTATLTVEQVDNGSSDNCNLTLSLDKTSFDCSNLGTNTVTLTGTDQFGNQTSKTATVSIEDNITPTVIGKDIIVAIGPSGDVTVSPAQVDDGSFDNCNLTLTLDKFTFDCNELGENPVTLTGTDASGNSASVPVVITVVDNSAPVIFAPDITVALDETGNAVITVDDVDAGSTDNCGIADRTISRTTFNCDDLGQNTITLTITDVNGNVSTQTVTVTVIDDTAPDFDVMDVTVELDENGEASIEPGDILTSYVEECDVERYGSSHAVWLSKYTPTGSNAHFYFDENGGLLKQFQDGTATVTGIIVNKNDANDSWAVQLNLAERRTWDEWSALGRSWKGKASNVGDNYEDWSYYIMDTNPAKPTTLTGLGSNAGKVKTLTHKPASYKYGFQVGQAANDKNTDFGMSGWFSYENDLGNMVQGDFNLKITECVLTTGGGPCGREVITIEKTDFTCADEGENTITVTATDQSGNTTVKTSTVTVEDNTVPTVSAQDLTIALDANGMASITTEDVDTGSFDNCNFSLTLSNENFDCSNIGENEVTLTATDDAGNVSSTTVTITIVDDQLPTVITKDATVELDDNGNASITLSDIDNGSYDNCQLTLSLDKLEFDCDDLGENTVTLTGVDAAGNTVSQTATVIVEDNSAPEVFTLAASYFLDENGSFVIDPNDLLKWQPTGGRGGSNITSDNCGIVSVTASQTVFGCDDLGQNTITITVSDAAGNTTTATTTVTIGDNTLPTVITKDATIELDQNGIAILDPAEIDGGSYDNCGVTLSVSQSEFSCGNIGMNTVTLIVTDGSGLTSSAQATVTVVDNRAPEVVTQNITVTLDENGEASIQTKDLLVVCPDVELPDDNDGGPTGETVPGAGSAYVVASNIEVPSCTRDNCSIAEISASKKEFDCNDLGQNIVTVTVTDGSGNTTTATAVVTVVDDQVPTAVAQDLTVSLDENGEASITADQIDNGSSDNCDITVSIDKENFDCSDIGDNTVTLTATDAAGNTAVTTATVTVVDETAPVINAQNATVALDENGNASIDLTDVLSEWGQECDASAAQGDGHAVWLSQYTTSGGTADFVFDNDGGTFSANADGTASVTGIVYNTQDANDKWAVQLNLSNGMTWDEWSELGRSYKDESGHADDHYLDWTYYIMDTNNPSTLTGLGDNAGQVKTLDHKPSNYYYGFQQGVGANNKNGGYGISGWFSYVNRYGNMVQGDFNLDLDNCEITTGSGNCGKEVITVDNTDFDCSNLGDNTVTLTAVDPYGNTSTATATVTVVDNQNPTLNDVPGDITYQETDADCGQAISWTPPTASDNCAVTVTSTHNPGDVFPVGTTTVVYTATDAAGNEVSESFDVEVIPMALEVSLETVVRNQDEGYNISCYEGNDGVIDATVTGGCAPYTFNWSNGASTEDLADLTAGTYTLTVTDGNGTTTTTAITLTQPGEYGVSVGMTPKKAVEQYGEIHTIYLGYGEQYAMLEANAYGGNGDYTYDWSTGGEVLCSDGNVATIAPEVTTTYTVLVTDKNGCTVSKDFTVNVIDTRCGDDFNPTDGGNGLLPQADSPFIGRSNENVIAGVGSDMFTGPSALTHHKDKDDDKSSCKCEDKMKNFTVRYTGFSGYTVKVYNKKKNKIVQTFYNVQYGDELTVNGFDSKGKLESKTFLAIGNYIKEIHTSCSENIVGNVYGPYTVINYTDGKGNFCDGTGNSGGGSNDDDKGGKDDDDDDKGGKDDDDDDKGGKDDDDDDKGGKDDDDDDKGGKDDDDDDKGGKDDDDDDKGGKDDDDDDKGGKDDDDDDKGGKDDDDDDKGGKDDDDDDKGGKDDDDDDKGDDDDDDNGDDGCQCKGKMKSFTVVYRGQSGVTIKAYKKNGYKFKTFTNVQDGDELLINGFGSKGELDSKTYLRVNYGTYHKIYSSCSKDILGNIYGPFEVVSYTDGEGSTCEKEPDFIEVCDTQIPVWKGDITLCYNGVSICVPKSSVDWYLGRGASLGNCNVVNNDGGVIGSINVADGSLGTVEQPIDKSAPSIELSTYPNPTTDRATINFTTDQAGPVAVGIYNAEGLRVGQLFEGTAEANTEYTVTFDATNVPTGVYIVRLQTSGYIRNLKLLVRR